MLKEKDVYGKIVDAKIMDYVMLTVFATVKMNMKDLVAKQKLMLVRIIALTEEYAY